MNYDLPNLDPGASAFNFPGVMPRMIDPSQIQPATQDPNAPPMPAQIEAPSRPSLIDRVLAKLYPEGVFGGFLSPEALASERRMALRKAGLSLMAAGGPRPQGTRNVGADIAQALDPSQWEQHLSGVAQTGMQLQSMMKKMQDDQKAQQIMAANPAKPNETPQQYEQRLRRLSGLFLQSGLADHAKVVSGMISEVRPEKVDTELIGPDKTPDGSVQLINKGTGDVINTWKPGEKPVLSPEQRVSNTLAYKKQFEAEVSEYASASKAYTTYQNLRTSKGGPVNDPIRLAAALRVVAPSMSVTPDQILRGQGGGDLESLPFIGPLIKAFNEKGELDQAGRTALDAIVDNEIMNKRSAAGALVQRHTTLGQAVGLNPGEYVYNPFEEASKTPIPAKVTQGADKVRKVLGR